MNRNEYFPMYEWTRERVAVGRSGVVTTEKREGDVQLINPALVAWRERKGSPGAAGVKSPAVGG